MIDLSGVQWNSAIKSDQERTARHESGHAFFAWLYSSQDLQDPPFTKICIGKAKGSGVDIAWRTFPSDPICKGAVLLAGIFAQENAEATNTVKKWIDVVERAQHRPEDGAKDYADAKKLAEDNGIDWRVFLEKVHDKLSSAKNARNSIERITELLLSKPLPVELEISDGGLQDILKTITRHMRQ